MDARHVIGLVVLAAAVAMAGCSAAGSATVDAVNDTELAADTSRSVENERRLDIGGDHRPWRIAAQAIENGSTTVTADREPVDTAEPWAYEGAYFRLNGSVVGTQSAYRVDIRIDYNGSAPDGAAVQYDRLPTPDRNALDALLPQRHPPEGPGVDFGAAVTYTPGELNDSALVGGGYDVVVFDGERYPIEVDEPEPVELERYRYRATRIADDAATYARSLRARYAFDLRGLEDPARSVFEDAVTDGSYYAESTDDSGFEALVDRITRETAITRSDGHGTWLARYEGERYLIELEFEAFRG